MYIECLCLGCKGKDKVDQETCFADDEVKVIDNANVNVNDNDNDNDNNEIKDNTNDNINVTDGKASAMPFYGWSKTHKVNDIVKANDEVKDNDKVKDNDNVIVNNNVNDNNNNNNKNDNDNDDDIDNFIYLFGEKLRGIPMTHSNYPKNFF